MASVYKRKNNYCVVYWYKDKDGLRHQKWETFKTRADARARAAVLNAQGAEPDFPALKVATVADLLREYIEGYGKKKWAPSTYTSNVGLIQHYIIPVIGSMKLSEIKPRMIERYYAKLATMPAVERANGTHTGENISAATIHEINKILHNCFNQAIRWEMMDRNPCDHVELPAYKPHVRNMWTIDDFMKANEVCEDPLLKLAMNLLVSCTLRPGELLGLTWDCIDISEEAVANKTPYVYVNKELQRVDKKILQETGGRDIITIFPGRSSKNTTTLVLKTPKTDSSVRKVFIPETVVGMLREWKSEQDDVKRYLGSEYSNYNLVFASSLGMPIETGTMESRFRRLIKKHDLPPVVPHSLRHTSITYKLKLNNGDIKAVQGDSGHSQAKMVTDQYSHILDEGRINNAQLIEKYMYQREDKDRAGAAAGKSVDAEASAILSLLKGNPELAAALSKALASGSDFK